MRRLRGDALRKRGQPETAAAAYQGAVDDFAAAFRLDPTLARSFGAKRTEAQKLLEERR